MFNIPNEYNQSVSGSLNSGGRVELPFPHVYFSFHNGSRSVDVGKPEVHYGGFKADHADVVAWLGSIGKEAAINHFALHELVPRQGEPYKVYMRRSLAIAPVAVRSRWFKDKNTGKSVFKAQIAGLTAVGKPLEALGAVVLTARGHQAAKLLDALRASERASADARMQFAGGAAANFFYSFIGTFGEYHQEMVGKSSQSPITPIRSWSGEFKTAEELASIYVGDEFAGIIADYSTQARAWVDDWKKEDAGADDEPASEVYFDESPY